MEQLCCLFSLGFRLSVELKELNSSKRSRGSSFDFKTVNTGDILKEKNE